MPVTTLQQTLAEPKGLLDFRPKARSFCRFPQAVEDNSRSLPASAAFHATSPMMFALFHFGLFSRSLEKISFCISFDVLHFPDRFARRRHRVMNIMPSSSGTNAEIGVRKLSAQNAATSFSILIEAVISAPLAEFSRHVRCALTM